MNFDIRIPIGSMFAILGAILTVYGLVSERAIYAKSLGLNVNFTWGLVLLLFGAVMLGLAKLKSSRASRAARPSTPAHPGPSSERPALT
jgi:hypothetical protein